MSDLVQELKAFAKVMQTGFTKEQIVAGFTPAAKIEMDGRTFDREAFAAMQLGRDQMFDSAAVRYHAVAQTGNAVLSHHSVAHTIKSTGQKIDFDAFLHVEYDGKLISYFHVNIRAPEGVDMDALKAQLAKQ